MSVIDFLKQAKAPPELLQLFTNVNVSRYEKIEKIDGKSFGIYLYKQDVDAELTRLTNILDYLNVVERLKTFVLGNYHITPSGEEFCLHFPIGSNALIRTHTKPSASEYKKYGKSQLGDLGIKGFTLTDAGEIKDIKYYYSREHTITTVKYSPGGKLLDVLLTDCITKRNSNGSEITMQRRDGQTYNMISHHFYNSFIEP
jgi:hypothetical protein